MNNQTPFGKRDEGSLPDGDLAFIGVEERTVFATAGYVNRAKNCRFRYQRAATRDGITILPWGKGNGLQPWTEVYGGFVYADPNGINEYILVAADGGVWMTRPNSPARQIPLPAGVTLTKATFKAFKQANASIVLLRGFSTDGKSLLPLQLETLADGSPDWQTGFLPIGQENVWPATMAAATNRIQLAANNLLTGDPVQLQPATAAAKTVNVSQLTRQKTTATATSANHGLRVGQVVAITGATPTAYNVTATVTAVTANTFQFLLPADPGANATGSIVATLRNLPVGLVAGQTYYVLTTPNADEFTIAATPGGDAVTWNTAPTDTATYPIEVTVLDGAYPIPEAVEGVFAQNRLFLIDGKDTLAVSDIGDFTRWVPTQSEFRINAGDAYTLKYVYLFNESTLLTFKSGSVSKVLGVTGDLSGATGPLNVTQAYGMAAPSVADIGTDVYWLNSELRITSLNLTELNKEQGTDQALSDPLLYTFGRINPGLAGLARLTVFDGYLHVALPLDDALILAPDNLVPAGAVYAPPYPVGFVSYQVNLAPGWYQWTAGPADQQLLASVGGNVATYNGDTVFYTDSYVVVIARLGVTAGTAVGSQLQAVLVRNSNTAVAVYDFLNKAWCGTDESTVTCVVDWLKFNYNGKQQLAFIGADGYLHLYADGYEDETVAPGDLYVDFFCDAANTTTLPNATDTFNIQSLYLQQNRSSAANTNPQPANPAVWGMYLPNPGDNLWQDANGQGGLNPASTHPWSIGTSPSVCTVTRIADGVRFTPTNGVLPSFQINGVAVPTTTGIVVGNGGCMTYYFDWHTGDNAVSSLPIFSWIRTRALPCKSWASYAQIYTTGGRLDSKRYTCVALHIATWDPSYTINTVTQGAEELTEYLANEGRNYLNYFQPFDAAAWNPDNSNDDFHASSREDYAYPETGLGIYLGSGVNFDQMQEYVHRVPISEHGLFVQLDVTNASGRLELVAASLEAQTSDTQTGPDAN